MEGRASVSGAIYLQKFDGYQGYAKGLSVIDSNTGEPVDLPRGIVFDGDASISGAELEGQIFPARTAHGI